jgi:hypothetical protein
MPEAEPTLEQWRRLYEVAGRVKQTAPWQWMLETDLFAIQDPQTGEVGFVSVMGNLGEHLGIANYPGALGFHGFWRMATGNERTVEDEFFMLPQLQASFEDRAQLDKRDRELIQALGLKYRGKQAWPLFRSYRPGYMAWHLEAPEADLLYWTLEQLLEVASRFQDLARPVRARIPTEYLLRVPAVVGDTVRWRDDVAPAPDPPEREIAIELAPGLLESARRVKRGMREIEVDVSPQPFVIGERGQRPQVPFMLIAVDVESGSLLCADVLTAEGSIAAMYGKAPGHLLAAIAQLGTRPATIGVCNWRLESVLAPIAPAIGAKLARKKRLPALERVSRELERFMGRS